MSSAADKKKAENFSKNSNLDDSSISSLAFLSRTNLEMHNILVSTKLVKKILDNLDFFKGVCSWLYSTGDYKQVWVWCFMHTSSTLQYEAMFPRLLQGLICGPYIWDYWGEVYG